MYSAGYKLGMFMAVVTGAFRFAWQPFFLSHAGRPDAPRLFARVLTYYLLVTSTLFLALTFFVNTLVKTHWPGIGYLIHPDYWAGLSVFPIILLAHLFDGVYANLMVGVYLKKLTAWLPLVTGAGAAFTIAFCLLLVPAYGMNAAAWITLIAFVLEAVLCWFVVRRAYPVPYEWAAACLNLVLSVALCCSWHTCLRSAVAWRASSFSSRFRRCSTRLAFWTTAKYSTCANSCSGNENSLHRRRARFRDPLAVQSRARAPR